MTQLALVIDLNVCVGCSACVVSCKEWNTTSSDFNRNSSIPSLYNSDGVFYNQVQTYEVGRYPIYTRTVIELNLIP